MFKDKSIIICGSGASIPFDDEQFKRIGNGLPEQLINIIQNTYSIGLNAFYQYGCATTFTTFVDFSFYKFRMKEVAELPLVIGKIDKPAMRNQVLPPNIIWLPVGHYYMGEEAWYINSKICTKCQNKIPLDSKEPSCPKCHSTLRPCGFYHSHLNGMFALSIAIALGFKNIYLLGYDGGATNSKTHFYQSILPEVELHSDKYRGVGVTEVRGATKYKTSTYNDIQKLNKVWFAPFKDIKDINIYNVSENSKIDTFPKISYSEFYMHYIKYEKINQAETQQQIREYIKVKTQC